ncbi:MAG: LapA family protein [Pelistega sp.]|nr:LapA family protein [Pelistega sp.]
MRYLIWALRLIIFVLVLLFAVKNTAPIAVNLYGDVTLPSVPLVVVLLIAFIAGALYMYLLTLPTRYRQSREVSRLKSEVKHLQSDLTVVTNQQHAAQQSSYSSSPANVPSGYVAIKND